MPTALSRQISNQLIELICIVQHRPVPKTNKFGLEFRHFFDRLAICCHVCGKHFRGLAQTYRRSEQVRIPQNITSNQDAIFLTPENNVPGRMPRRIQHSKAANLVTLLQAAGDGVGWPGPIFFLKANDEVIGGFSKKTVFHCCHIIFATPQRNIQFLANGGAGSLMVWVGMR